MRILVANPYARGFAGIESYLSGVVPALARAGEEVALLFELDAPAEREPLPSAGQVWCASKMGLASAIRLSREWHPDLIYTHGTLNPALEQMVLDIAPAVHFAHDYTATCISGLKAFAVPRMRPCSRPFGWQCLLHYFPRRCGGRNPLTMVSRYQRANERLKLMQRYRHILVASEAMRQEYLRNGFLPDRVSVCPLSIAEQGSDELAAGRADGFAKFGVEGEDEPVRLAFGNGPLFHLLFAGRMVPVKGGRVLLEALPLVAAKLERPLTLTLAGDGPVRTQWEQQARILCERSPSVSVRFTGWLSDAALREMFEACDLLVVPSLWPEPFGLIGPEAGTHGLPAAAFDVGGIRQWLHDGINGFLAPGDPPTAGGLATAIAKCLAEPWQYQELRRGARNAAMGFRLEQHVEGLRGIFSQVIAENA